MNETCESYLPLNGGMIYVRHTPMVAGRKTLLFMHGLGESGLCFDEAFQCLSANELNLVVPDNIGYGRSSAARDGDYSFVAQVARLRALARQMHLDDLVLLGHSLGGILASLWGAEAPAEISAVVNIEGNLTPQDATFSRQAAEASIALQQDFPAWRDWFRGEFVHQTVLSAPDDPRALHRYCASMLFCRPEAFLANSLEIMERSAFTQGAPESSLMRVYESLPVPTLYCWGTESLSAETKKFLTERQLPNHAFAGAGHWPMLHDPALFYAVIENFTLAI